MAKITRRTTNGGKRHRHNNDIIIRCNAYPADMNQFIILNNDLIHLENAWGDTIMQFAVAYMNDYDLYELNIPDDIISMQFNVYPIHKTEAYTWDIMLNTYSHYPLIFDINRWEECCYLKTKSARIEQGMRTLVPRHSIESYLGNVSTGRADTIVGYSLTQPPVKARLSLMETDDGVYVSFTYIGHNMDAAGEVSSDTQHRADIPLRDFVDLLVYGGRVEVPEDLYSDIDKGELEEW